ncbi:alpha/beta hydrolase fold domain-containing protein [Luteimonas sp. RIT-PG2_3]
MSTAHPHATWVDDVDPDIRLFQQRMNAGYAAFPDFARLPLPQMRAAAEQVRAPWVQGGPQMAQTRELRVGTLQTRIRIHLPQASATQAALPALVYLHGGGWTLFSLDTHDRLMREYAARAGIAVVGIDYSLSPEARFPRAIDETLDVLQWLRAHGGEHGIDVARLAMGGDSAGANLTVATHLRLRALGLPQTSAMLLNYGAFTDQDSPSMTRYDGARYMLETGEMQWFWNNYLHDDADRSNPQALPLLAELEDLAVLPPAFLAIAECDILADGNHAMAARLAEAGVAVKARSYAGATHSFLEAVSISPMSDRALDEAANWLKAHWSQA